MSLKSSVEQQYGVEVALAGDGPLAEKMTQYAGLLAAQGALSAALAYLGSGEGSGPSDSIGDLRNRLRGALGYGSQGDRSSRQRTPMQQHQQLGRKTSSGNYDY